MSQSGYRMRGLQGRVIEALGEAIVGGEFRPGEVLPRERDLMARFQASRTSLREALKVLAAKGLIEMRQRVGTRVRSSDLWNAFDSDVLTWRHRQGMGECVFRDFIELRQVIEPAAARLAAGRATMNDLRRIERAQKAMAAAAEDGVGYAAADVEFHMAVFEASHNIMLAGFAHIVGDFLRMSFDVQQQALNEADNRAEDDARNHRLIYEAINLGDGTAAADAMLRVILEGKRSLIEALAPEAAAAK
ncbi:FadR/GntR family transcriptional regulator [Tianweitania sediminis]|uniref:FadR family transcriptional regulator n=1 Tax=Tianweitania sediminis TaxID=1502156 RepID=A0A8J7UKH2_9HYPH|nr:FadR/GntR family transcriptional regulator [Tianweitania sediminis]MBP0438367.1 FadR family transcriptional regulator [Tianweitania sediminis]